MASLSKIGLGIMIASTLSSLGGMTNGEYNVLKGNRYALQASTLREYSERPNQAKLAEFDSKRINYHLKGLNSYIFSVGSIVPLVIGAGITRRGFRRRREEIAPEKED